MWFWPMAAMVALTALVWVALYVQRFGEMRRRRIDPQQLFDRRARVETLQHTSAADNFNNLLELPTLFHVAMLAAMALGVVDALLHDLAFAYVGLCAAHSFIHVTYNRVVHRFIAYALSTVVLFAIWIRLALLVAAA